MIEDEDKKIVEKPVEKTEKVEKTEVRGVQSAPVKRQMSSWAPWVGGGVLVVLLLLGAFWAGRAMNRERSLTIDRDGSFSTMRGYGGMSGGTQNMPTGDFRGGRGMMGTIGTVTAASSESITVKDTQRGGSVTFKIDSNTKVTSGADTKAVSDIKTDATVRIQASSSDSLTAATIAIQS